MSYNIVTVETFREAAEILSSYVFDIGCKGIEIIEDNCVVNEVNSDEKISTTDNGKDTDSLEQDDWIKIEMFFSMEENMEEKIQSIRNELSCMSVWTEVGPFTIAYRPLTDDTWLHNWKKYYKPFRVCDNIVIKPQWESYDTLRENDIVIEIDPGTVFGSGTHETTSLAIKLIKKYLEKGQNTVDVGCGTGVLGIVAGKLGAKHVTCIDIDKECVAVTKNNIILNKLDEVVHAVHGNLIEKIHEKADIVIANILAEVLVELTDSMDAVLKRGGIYILSGIIQEKRQLLEQKLLENGFTLLEVVEDGEWIAIAARLSEVSNA